MLNYQKFLNESINTVIGCNIHPTPKNNKFCCMSQMTVIQLTSGSWPAIQY